MFYTDATTRLPVSLVPREADTVSAIELERQMDAAMAAESRATRESPSLCDPRYKTALALVREVGVNSIECFE